jgi:uncharacterized protein (DUF302 family)
MEEMPMRTAKQHSEFQTYSHARTLYLPDMDPAEVRDRLAYALEQNGFSLLAEFDLGEILERRLDVRIEPHFVLEVCHPDLARRALSVASDVSLLLPCRVGVWKEGTGATVGLLPPKRLVQALGREHLDEVAAEAEQRIERALGMLSHPGPRSSLPPSRTPSPELTASERAVLVEALGQRKQALLVEAAGTEKHDLQHALAQNIEQLEVLMRKLGQSGRAA